jgi:O-antigen/teichoic acid export membrane protein
MILLREVATRYREPVIRRDALWTLINFIAQAAIGGILATAIGRHFGPEVKGYASLLTVGPTIASWLLALGIGSATMYFSAGKRIAVDELLSVATVLAAGLGLVAAVLGWLVLAPGVGSPEVLVALAVGLVLATVQLLREFHGAALLGLNHVTLYAKTTIVARIAGVALVLPAVYLAPLGVFYLLIPISLAVSNLVVVGEVRRVLRWRWRWSAETLRRQLGYGIRSHVGDAVVVALLKLDQLAVYLYLGATSLGLYSVGVLFSDLLAQAAQAAGYLFFARIAAAGPRAHYLARLAVAVSAVGLLAVALPVLFFADRLVVGLFGPGFEAAVGSTRILALAGVAQGSGRVAVMGLRALGSPLRSSAVHLAGLVAEVPLLVVLTPSRGLEGVATATLLANVVVVVGAYFAFRATRGGRPIDALASNRVDGTSSDGR